MMRLGRASVAATSVGVLLLWGCGQDPTTEPGSDDNPVQIKVVAPDPQAGISDAIRLETLRSPKGLASARRAGQTAQMVLPFPPDTAFERCKSGENCKEQGKTWTGQFYVTCLSGPGQCGNDTYTWDLSSPPPGTTISFDPTATVIEERTTMTIEVEDDAETGVFESTVSAPPSPNPYSFKFHTQCSWGLNTCPRLEILDLLASGTVVSVSTAGEQSRLIGKRMHLKVQHKSGTGEHTFEQEEQAWLIEWSGQGELVHGYDIAATQLQLWPWPQGIGTTDTISYYHVIPNQYVVWAQADLNYDNDEAEVRVLTKGVFNVGGPSFTSMGGTTHPSGMLVNQTEISFGDPTGTPGIAYNFVASSSGNGYLGATQLVKPDLLVKDIHGNSESYAPGYYKLDGCSLYPYPVQNQSTWQSDDTPGWAILNAHPDLNEVKFAADFHIYFMYRPSGPNAIWVPLGKMDWDYDGTAVKQGGVWSLQSGATWAANPSGQTTSEFPTWTEVQQTGQTCPPIPSSIRR